MCHHETSLLIQSRNIVKTVKYQLDELILPWYWRELETFWQISSLQTCEKSAKNRHPLFFGNGNIAYSTSQRNEGAGMDERRQVLSGDGVFLGSPAEKLSP